VLLLGLTIFGLIRTFTTAPTPGRWVTLAVAAWLVAIVFMTVRPGSGLGVRLNLIPIIVDGPGSAFDAILNVVVFLPLGVLLATAGWRLLAGVAFAFAASLGIEITQYLTDWGRTADINDIITNVAGAAIGWLVVWAIRRGRRTGSADAVRRLLSDGE
jgi:glycopeptide antibiotics resistance protein